LESCPKAFAFDLDDRAFRSLRAYLPRLRRAPSAAAVLAACARGETAVAFTGHPVLANRAGCAFLSACAGRRLRRRVHPANSLLSTAIVLGDRAINPNTHRGLDAVDVDRLDESPGLFDSGDLVVVYGGKTLDLARLSRALTASPAPRRRVWLGRAGARPQTVPIERLAQAPPASWALVASRDL
jgi:hypothetical protein